jgi:iron-sulfur cluster repair protein YtfE (RIC family)
MTAKTPREDDALPLDHREGLPDELRVLLADYPRDGWQQHPDFNGLVAFWLDRHLNFRRMLVQLQADAGAMIDRTIAPDLYRQRLQRLGSGLLNDLIGHHQIEDDAYFPQLAAMEPRLIRGFEMLDRDHHDLHDLLDRFAAGANAVLQAVNGTPMHDAAGVFKEDLTRLDRMLIRHLTDEEDLVLPVVLKHRVG